MVPSQIPKYTGHIVLTTQYEAPPPFPRPVLYDTELEWGRGIAFAILLKRCGADIYDDSLVVGVDPGRRLGLAIFYAGIEVEREIFFSEAALVSYICSMLQWDGTANRVIRIGSGNAAAARRLAAMISAECPDSCRLELVNESGTSPRCRYCNSRGKRDMLAAKAIAQIHTGATVAG